MLFGAKLPILPGIYFAGNEVKTRGIERGRIYGMRQEFEKAWEYYYWNDRNVDQYVNVPVVNFITARQALMRRKWNLAGVWQEDLREIHFDWYNKRGSVITLPTKAGEEHIRTTPQTGEQDSESVPYSRIIGGGLIVADQDRYVSEGLKEKERIEEQPDWVEPLY